MVCDITLESQVTNVYETIMSKYGKLDILINNAGTSFKEKAYELSYESWKKVIDINLNGAFLCARDAMKIMVNQKSGRIINIASIYGVYAPDLSIYKGTTMANPAAYAASKGGLIQLTKCFFLWHVE